MQSQLLHKLAQLSARYGANPLLTQGAGGNTSIKDSKALIIKASGKRLSQALNEDIFVEMDQQRLLSAIGRGEEIDFNANLKGPLRGSIETPLHAVIPQTVVVHLHSVRTLAHAIRVNARQALEERLAGLPWALVPYAKPGWPLTWELQKTLAQSPSVWVLQNHGLIVAADSCEGAEVLLDEVERRLERSPTNESSSPSSALQSWVASHPEYRLPRENHAHTLAFCGETLDRLVQGVLCPDQAVFLGREVEVVNDLAELPASPTAVATVVRQHGVLLKASASQGSDDLVTCLGLLASRVEPSDKFSYLSQPQIEELLDWDAEKHRQALDRTR